MNFHGGYSTFEFLILSSFRADAVPKWMKSVVSDFQKIVTEVEENIGSRKVFLKNNLGSWIQFEEMVDQINNHLDGVETENLNRSIRSHNSLHSVEQQMQKLEKHKQNMVCVI